MNKKGKEMNKKGKRKRNKIQTEGFTGGYDVAEYDAAGAPVELPLPLCDSEAACALTGDCWAGFSCSPTGISESTSLDNVSSS